MVLDRLYQNRIRALSSVLLNVQGPSCLWQLSIAWLSDPISRVEMLEKVRVDSLDPRDVTPEARDSVSSAKAAWEISQSLRILR